MIYIHARSMGEVFECRTLDIPASGAANGAGIADGEEQAESGARFPCGCSESPPPIPQPGVGFRLGVSSGPIRGGVPYIPPPETPGGCQGIGLTHRSSGGGSMSWDSDEARARAVFCGDQAPPHYHPFGAPAGPRVLSERGVLVGAGGLMVGGSKNILLPSGPPALPPPLADGRIGQLIRRLGKSSAGRVMAEDQRVTHECQPEECRSASGSTSAISDRWGPIRAVWEPPVRRAARGQSVLSGKSRGQALIRWFGCCSRPCLSAPWWFLPAAPGTGTASPRRRT